MHKVREKLMMMSWHMMLKEQMSRSKNVWWWSCRTKPRHWMSESHRIE